MIAPFRIGTTSFIYADARSGGRTDSWLANVERLAGRVDDVEILLFEHDSVPDPAEIAALAAWKPRAGLSYTVHTPLDVSLASETEARRLQSIDRVCAAIELARPLAPEGYIVHVYLGDREGDTPPVDRVAWRRRAAASLEAILARGISAAEICIETLDYDFAYLEPVVSDLGLSVALDLGHLDRDGRDERALLDRNLHRTRAIQWHGVEPGGRDHRSLRHYPAGKARWVIDVLKQCYRGVVTLEVFREADFEESLALIHELVRGEPARAGATTPARGHPVTVTTAASPNALDASELTVTHTPGLLIARFASDQAMASWAIVGGGLRTARAVAWVQVREGDLPPGLDAAALLRDRLAAAGVPDAVGLLTTRRLDRYVDVGIRHADIAARCIATVGTGNALRAGDPPDGSRFGTINVLCHVSVALSLEARLEALALAAEARTLAVLEAGVPSVRTGLPASGTGTDCIVIAAPACGDASPYAGKHTAIGHVIGAAVHAATQRGVACCQREWAERLAAEGGR